MTLSKSGVLWGDEEDGLMFKFIIGCYRNTLFILRDHLASEPFSFCVPTENLM